MVHSYSCVKMNWFDVVHLCFIIDADRLFKSSLNKLYLVVFEDGLALNYSHQQRYDVAQSLIFLL
jgi:hypothetical protein